MFSVKDAGAKAHFAASPLVDIARVGYGIPAPEKAEGIGPLRNGVIDEPV
jgi:hypothetical protein